MSASSRMHSSFATAARAPEHPRTLTETSQGSVFVFDPGRAPNISSLSLSGTAFQPLDTMTNRAQLPSDWTSLYIAGLCKYAKHAISPYERRILALHNTGLSYNETSRVLEAVEGSQHLKHLESRAVHRRASEQGADVVGKQLMTSILLSTTSAGCKSPESRVSSTLFTSINDSASSFKDSGCPNCRVPFAESLGMK
jgi:hypothetical protein